MTSLIEYLGRATLPEKKALLQQQWDEANEHGTIHCACGQKRALVMAYRCLYCGMWMCVPCAEVHFEMTLKEWVEKKRAEKRQSVGEEELYWVMVNPRRDNTCL